MCGIFILIDVVGRENIKMFVLDEADELLSRGFNEQINDIFAVLPKNVQVIVVSATMPCGLLEITAKLMNDPVKVLIKREERTLQGIRQFYVNVEREVDRHTCHSMMMN
jgi:translation initiation factor 4A